MKRAKVSRKSAKRLFDTLEVVSQRWPVRTSNFSTRAGQEGISVGLARDYSKSLPVVSESKVEQNREVFPIVNAIMKRYFPSFRYSTIQINKNYPGNLHVDKLNCGMSVMITVGSSDLEGGELYYEKKLIPTADRLIYFDGNLPHMTLPFKGTRYSLVLYNQSSACMLLDNIVTLKSIVRRLKSYSFRVDTATFAASCNSRREKDGAYGSKQERIMKARDFLLRPNGLSLLRRSTISMTSQQLNRRLKDGRA